MNTNASRLPAISEDRARWLDGTRGLSRALVTLGVLAVASAIALFVAVANVTYFQVVNGFVGATDEVARGVLFSTWLLLVGGPVIALRPARFGFTAGHMRRHWRLTLGTCAVGAAVTAVLVSFAGRLPYSDASPFIEIIDVPFTEELVFRGVFLTILMGALARMQPPSTAVALAVLFDGIAFGVAHVANALALDIAFVLSQATFATCLGIACAYLMLKTRSIYPAMLLHAAVNGVVVAL
jgi:membrane protease YdiL (CAAX protease family)